MLSRETRLRFLRFFTVGGIGMVVQLGSLKFLKEVLPPRVAFTIAYVLSVISHYSLNRFWALASHRRDTARQLIEYLSTVGLTYLISFASFNLFYAVFGLSVMVSTVLAVPPSTVVGFLIFNYRVFKHSPTR